MEGDAADAAGDNGMSDDKDGTKTPDDEKKKKRRRVDPSRRGNAKPVNWLAVMTDYAEGITDDGELARRHDTQPSTISRKRSNDAKAGRPWVSRDAVKHSLSSEITKQAVDKAAAEIVESPLGDMLVEHMKPRLILDKAAAAALAKGMREFTGPNYIPSRNGMASDLNELMDAYAKFTDRAPKVKDILEQQSPDDKADYGKEYVVAINPEEKNEETA